MVKVRIEGGEADSRYAPRGSVTMYLQQPSLLHVDAEAPDASSYCQHPHWHYRPSTPVADTEPATHSGCHTRQTGTHYPTHPGRVCVCVCVVPRPPTQTHTSLPARLIGSSAGFLLWPFLTALGQRESAE